MAKRRDTLRISPRSFSLVLLVGLFYLLNRLSGCVLQDAPTASPTAGEASATLISESNRQNTTIIVGSKDFAEQFLIGEMYALLLEEAGFRVERRLDLGPTPLVQEALLEGIIDLYPEYTGTALLTVLQLPSASDAEAVYDTVADEYQERFDLRWLAPAPMNNTQGFAMTREDAEKYGIRTFSELAEHASELVMMGPPEFMTREDGLPGLMAAYGNFEVKIYIPVEPTQRYQGLLNNQADVVVAFGTDGELAEYDLLLLEDDRHFFPPYQVAPIVRASLLAEAPEVGAILDALAPKLTNETMQRLNYEVSGRERTPAEVAREFLISEGMIEEQP
ncbi:MAG: quaternary ammonium transporter [Ardenticatenales bacterium]|nr:quaternary ammonium transporter [Ardenticatenales bacterium]